MIMFEYSVWFRDDNCLPSDQDYEWVACFHIEAETKDKAKLWGDEVSRYYVARNSANNFLNSDVKMPEGDKLPIVKFGIKPSDEYIGW